MIKPLIAAEDMGSNFQDAINKVEESIDARLQNVILHKNIDSGKKSNIFM